jgi:hypothetical protein
MVYNGRGCIAIDTVLLGYTVTLVYARIRHCLYVGCVVSVLASSHVIHNQLNITAGPVHWLGQQRIFLDCG